MEVHQVVQSISTIEWTGVSTLSEASHKEIIQHILSEHTSSHCYLIFLSEEEILQSSVQDWISLKQNLPMGSGYLIVPYALSEIRKSLFKATIYRPEYLYIPFLSTDWNDVEEKWDCLLNEGMTTALAVQWDDRYTSFSRTTWEKIKSRFGSYSRRRQKVTLVYPYPVKFLQFCEGVLKENYNLARAKKVSIIITYPLYELLTEEEKTAFSDIKIAENCTITTYTTPFVLDLNFFPAINEYTSLIVVERV